LDGKEPVAVRSRPLPIPIIDPPDDSEATDEEDWETMGIPGMRAASYEPSSFGSRRGSRMSSLAAPSIRSATPMTNGQGPTPSMDVFRSMSYSPGIIPFQRAYSSSLSSALRMHGVKEFGNLGAKPETCGSPQEQEAVEALLKMGGM